MKRIVLVSAFIMICLAFPAAAQNDSQMPLIYYTALGGGLFTLNLDTNESTLLFDFSREWDGGDTYWHSEEFSHDGEYLAGIRNENEQYHLFIARLVPWQITHRELHPGISDYSIELEWLPGDRYILISYWVEGMRGRYIDGRELYDLETDELAEFPYQCFELGMAFNGNVGIRFTPETFEFVGVRLETEVPINAPSQTVPPDLFYDLSLNTFSEIPSHYVRMTGISECGYTSSGTSWDWSAEYGFIAEVGNYPIGLDILWMQPATDERQRLLFDVPSPLLELRWSPDDGRYMLSVDNQTWTIYDSEKVMETPLYTFTLQLEDVDSFPFLFCNRQLIYSLRTGFTYTLHLVDTITQEERSMPLVDRVSAASFHRNLC